MRTSIGKNNDIYIRDAGNRVAAVSAYGLEQEAAQERVAGGGMFDWAADNRNPSSIVVLVAPSMERRFKSFEITDCDTFLVRTDGVRCQINCDPVLADGLATLETIVVTEASGQPNGENISYEVKVYSIDNTPAMRM